MKEATPKDMLVDFLERSIEEEKASDIVNQRKALVKDFAKLKKVVKEL